MWFLLFTARRVSVRVTTKRRGGVPSHLAAPGVSTMMGASSQRAEYLESSSSKTNQRYYMPP